MLRRYWLLLFFIAAQAHAMDMYRVGSRILEVGDTVGKLVDLIGDPQYKEPIETENGGFEGERWQYRRDGGSVTFVIREGKIRFIEQKRD